MSLFRGVAFSHSCPGPPDAMSAIPIRINHTDFCKVDTTVLDGAGQSSRKGLSIYSMICTIIAINVVGGCLLILVMQALRDYCCPVPTRRTTVLLRIIVVWVVVIEPY